MTQHAPETLLLRIRAETLRMNLERAHAAFKELPKLRSELNDFGERLKTMRDGAWTLAEGVQNLKAVVGKGEVPLSRDVGRVYDGLEAMAEALGKATNDLTELRRKSFLLQMRESEATWGSLRTTASDLQNKVEEIEKDLSGSKAWEALSAAEEEAKDSVFHESIELLGGIALRDARFGADICDLAEALIRSILETEPHPNVIPGGIGSMMMRIERFVRLQFPEWTIWGLPLVVSELWRISARAKFDTKIAESIGAGGLAKIQDAAIQRCLGDAYATYFMGPAYASAAVTLLFNPAQDDLRVHATRSMLGHMDLTDPGAASESYHTVCAELDSAWEAAKRQAGVPSEAPKAEVVEKAKVIKKAVETLFNQLQAFAYPDFTVDAWKSAFAWARQVNSDAAIETIQISDRLDLRHVLNAVWRARLDDARKGDISERALGLAHRVKTAMVDRAARGKPRGWPGIAVGN